MGEEAGHEGRVSRYTRIKYTVAIIDIIYLLFLLAAFQLTGFSIYLRDLLAKISTNNFIMVFLYSISVYILYLALSFPITFYRSFIVERQFGLSHQRLIPWFSDFLKAAVLSLALLVILAVAFFSLLRYQPENWWWQAAGFWIFLSVVIAQLFPILVIPLFYKYKKIDDDALRERIMDLSNKMSIKIMDVFEIDYSRKSTKGNAALVGLGNSKRVLLTDTLKDKFSHDEIEVILAHEFGHHKLKHILKLVILNAFVIILTFYLFHKFGRTIFDKFNIEIPDVAGMGIWLFLFTLLQFIYTPILNWISRSMEKKADLAALRFTGKREAFVSMLNKLTDQNLGERKPPLIAKIFFFDHPPVEERIALADKGQT